jgi:drug/metabolite transporter (DMT)-like permease
MQATTTKQEVKPVNWIGFLYIGLTILFTVYGQLIIKWQVDLAGEFPPDTGEKIFFIFKLLLNPWVISSFASAFIASLFWMAAMTQFDLSFAYPFMSLSYVIVMVLSFLFMNEPFSWNKVIGTLVIVAGLYIVTRQ